MIFLTQFFFLILSFSWLHLQMADEKTHNYLKLNIFFHEEINDLVFDAFDDDDKEDSYISSLAQLDCHCHHKVIIIMMYCICICMLQSAPMGLVN